MSMACSPYVEFERWEDGMVTARMECAPGLTVVLHSDAAHSPRAWEFEELEVLHEKHSGEGERSETIALGRSRYYAVLRLGRGVLDDYINREFDRWVRVEARCA